MPYRYKPSAEQQSDRERLGRLKRTDKDRYFHQLVTCNRLGITDHGLLDDVERTISGYRNIELKEHFVPGNFDFDHLKTTHKFLFQDIYYFAGEIRSMDMEIDSVTRFCPARRIEQEGQRIFSKLAQDNYFKGLAKPEFIEKLADFMTDINILHPFRDGNGRSKRAFCVELAMQAGYKLQFEKAADKKWLIADEIAFDSSEDKNHGRDTSYLKILLEQAVSLI